MEVHGAQAPPVRKSTSVDFKNVGRPRGRRGGGSPGRLGSYGAARESRPRGHRRRRRHPRSQLSPLARHRRGPVCILSACLPPPLPPHEPAQRPYPPRSVPAADPPAAAAFELRMRRHGRTLIGDAPSRDRNAPPAPISNRGTT